MVLLGYLQTAIVGRFGHAQLLLYLHPINTSSNQRLYLVSLLHSLRGTSSLMVVDCAPRVTWFKLKRFYRSDYFGPKPDKVVLFMCHIWVALRNLRNPCVNPTLHLKKKSIFCRSAFQ